MRKFKCSVCGFIYDEELGIPEKGVNPGTKWDDLPDDWKCPWCGAPKSAFKEINIQTEEIKTEVVREDEAEEVLQKDSLREVSFKEAKAICTNLAKGCDKQYLSRECELFNDLAEYFNSKIGVSEDNRFNELFNKVSADLERDYPKIKELCEVNNDRGTLRAVTWGEKASFVLKSILERYNNEGSSILENLNVYVCDICGFIYIGKASMEVCPICKVPSLKILQIKGDI